MRVLPSPLPDLILMECPTHVDERGFLRVTYRAADLASAGLPDRFAQDVHSRSRRGVLRGLHFQRRQPQAKLIYAAAGEIFDVAVDLRRDRPSFGRWHGELLSEANGRAMFLPAGFAHGFYVISEQADVIYKCSTPYDPDAQAGVAWNDPDLGIGWPLAGPPILSERDRRLPRLREVDHADLDHRG